MKTHQIIVLLHIANEWDLKNDGLSTEQTELAIEALIAKNYIKDEQTLTSGGKDALYRLLDAL